MIKTAEDIIKAYDKAKADKTVVESTWEDLVYYGMPRKRGVNTKYEPGEKPSTDVYDDSPVQSNLIMAAGLSGYMTNASQRWFELRTRDESLMRDNEVRKFFSHAQETIFLTLANTNFYQQIHEIYLDLGTFGTACMYEDEDVRDDIRFYARQPKEIFIVEDDREEATMVFRYFEMTAYQAYTFFGDAKVGEAICKCVEEQKDFTKKFCFIQYVCPRYERDVSRADNINMPIASYWVSMTDKKIVRESGYSEMPYFCPRFYKNSGEVYGYSPMYTVYPDVVMLNKAVETYINAAEIALYPPWIAEHDGIMGTLDVRSRAINYQRAPLSSGQQIQPLSTKNNIQVGLDFIERAEQKVRRAFFVDLFLMLTQQNNMTATEVIERTQEKMLILGPVLGRLQNELLSPIIVRTFNILLRRGKLAPIPPELGGKNFDVIYISPLAKAQRAVQAKDMQTFLTIVGQISQVAPQIIDKIDTDMVVDKMSFIYSIDPEIINDEESVAKVRENRAQQAQVQAQLNAASSMAATMKDGSAAGKNIADAQRQ